ncbi:MAG TPA: glycyl-radical enzyme activating protein [Bacteroidales bacterium]
MQGIVFDIKRFAVHDGPGIRTTVFLKGCPLRCFWCHNPEGIDAEPIQSVKKIKLDEFEFNKKEDVGIAFSVDQIMDMILKDRVFMEESGGGVTFSGGEPTLQPEFLLELLKECKREGLHTAVDTCGHTSRQTLSNILSLTDLFLYDLKHYDSLRHEASTGQSNDLILDNLEFLLRSGKKVRIRIPVIPGFNDTTHDLKTIALLLTSFHGTVEQVDLLPYHTTAQHKYKRFGVNNRMVGVKALKKEELAGAKKVFEGKGFKVKIGG